jgi:hypothetical protein
VPPAQRTPITRGANIVIVGGVVSGTWSLTEDAVVVDWFTRAAPSTRKAMAEEVARLATIVGRPLRTAS